MRCWKKLSAAFDAGDAATCEKITRQAMAAETSLRWAVEPRRFTESWREIPLVSRKCCY